MNRLLISTMLKVVYWDGHHPHVIHEGDLGAGYAHYHGITWDRTTLFITGAHNYGYVVRRFSLPDLQELEPIRGDLHAPHQAIYHSLTGRLYVTNTGKNRIEVWDGVGWSWHAWHASPCDVEHINGIWVDGRHVYVSEHRQAASGVSAVRICSMDLEMQRLVEVGPNIHNVYVERGVLYNLTSHNDKGNAGILATNLETLEMRRIDKPEWGHVLLRGLARTNRSWYIGMSRWEEDRSKRHVGDAIVVQLDDEFRELDRVVLPDYGPVCSVRVLEDVDYAHNWLVQSLEV